MPILHPIFILIFLFLAFASYWEIATGIGVSVAVACNGKDALKQEIKSILVYRMSLAWIDQAASFCCLVSSSVAGTPSLKTVPPSNSLMRSTPRMRRHDFSAS